MVSLVGTTQLVSSSASAQGVGSIFSGSTTADGSSPFWNPAAMAEGDGTHLELDAGVAFIGAEYQASGDRGTSSAFLPKPTGTLGFFSDALGPQWRFGMTLSIPQATGGNWNAQDPAGQITRYYIERALIFHVGATPAVSYSPTPWLTLGAGFTVAHARLDSNLSKDLGSELNQTINSDDPEGPFPYANENLAAPVALAADGWGIGAVAGVVVEPVPELTIGVGFRSPLAVTTQGSVEVTYPEPLREYVEATLPGAELPELSGDIEIPLNLELQLNAGVTYRPTEQWAITADYRFQQTSTQESLDVNVVQTTSASINDVRTIKALNDIHHFILRGEYLALPELRLALSARFETNAVPETVHTPSNIGFAKFEVGVGAAWRVSELVSLSAQYSHFFIPEETIETSLHRPLSRSSLASFNHPSPTGTYSASSDAFSLGLVLHL